MVVARKCAEAQEDLRRLGRSPSPTGVQEKKYFSSAGRQNFGLYSLVGITTHLNPRMRGLECSERHPRYAVSHDPHCRCPGLSIIARFIAAPWTTKRDHWRERERQIKRLSLATLARRCRVEFGRRFPRPGRWLAVDFLGGSRDHRTRCSSGTPRGRTPGEA